MTWVSMNGISAPGWIVTMLTCMSWRMSTGSTKRVVAQAPSVSTHGDGRVILVVVDERLGDIDALDLLIALADPVETAPPARYGCGWSRYNPAADRHTNPSAGVCDLPSTVRVRAPSVTKMTLSASGSVSGRSLPPSGDSSTSICEKVSAKPESGRANTQARSPVQCGNADVTMSVITSRGMKA